MDLSFIFYLFAAFIIIPGTFFVFSSMRKYFAALIATIGMLVFFILFGIQLFNSSGNMIETTVQSKFPPKINLCPDMFLLTKDSSNKPVCVDTIGLGTSLNKYTSGSITPCTISNGACTGGANAIKLYTDTSDNANRKTSIINDLKVLRITWEGIWDGLQEYDNTIPRPT